MPGLTQPQLTITPTIARRLSITKQRLAGPRPPSTPEGILETVRQLTCLQLDPISVVARSHQLVLWSRHGKYNPTTVDALLYEERNLFEYWAHCASIVLTEDYPIHNVLMRAFNNGESGWFRGVRQWLDDNRELRDHILAEIGRNGPMLSSQFEDKSQEGWSSSGWSGGRNVSKMLDFLWLQGHLMVAGRKGIQKRWDLAERCLPGWTPKEELTREEVTRVAAEKSLRSLGVATTADIRYNFIRGQYHSLPKVLKELEQAGRIRQVSVAGEKGALPGPWYVHCDDLELLERISAGEWQPRTTLLSPFDNLIAFRKRGELLFDFEYRMEIYVPKAQRKYGYYVLPVLHGDRFVARVDPQLDRKAGVLMVNAVHKEPAAPDDAATGKAVAQAIEELADFLGASKINYGEKVPPEWSKVMR